MTTKARFGTVIAGGALALLCLLLTRGAQAFFGDKRHTLDGAVEIFLPRSFSLFADGYGRPRVDRVKGRTPVITGGTSLGYRFVAGRFSEWLVLGGTVETNPVILDVTVFPAGDPETLLSNQGCFSVEAWGYGNCGGTPESEFASARSLPDLADVVYQKDSVTVYRNRSTVLAPANDSKHNPALGFAAVDAAKRIRADLYVSFGRYSADDAVKLLVNIVASARVNAGEFAGHLTQLNAAAREKRDRLQAQFDAIAEPLATIGLSLDDISHYNLSDGGIASVNFENERIEEITVAAALGRVRTPGRGPSSPNLTKLRAVADPQDYGLPVPVVLEESDSKIDRWFSVAYWNEKRRDWRTLEIKPERPAAKRTVDPRYEAILPREKAPATEGGQRDAYRKIPALEELSKNWSDRNALHVFQMLSFTAYHYRYDDDPAVMRRMVSQFADAIRRMRQDMASGKLVVMDP
jgi:hypothetical protein